MGKGGLADHAAPGQHGDLRRADMIQRKAKLVPPIRGHILRHIDLEAVQHINHAVDHGGRTGKKVVHKANGSVHGSADGGDNAVPCRVGTAVDSLPGIGKLLPDIIQPAGEEIRDLAPDAGNAVQ